MLPDEQAQAPVAQPEIGDKIDELIQYEKDDLGDDNFKFLEEHKDMLTEDELKKYGITVGNPADKSEDKKEDQNTPVTPVVIDVEKTEVQLRDAFGVDNSDLDDSEKKIMQKLAPSFKGQQDTLMRNEIATLVSTNPIFAPYKGLIEKYAKNPAYERVPIDFIAKGLAHDEAMKIALKKGSEAEKNASQINGRRQAPGSGRRGSGSPTSGLPDTSKMNNEQFEAYINDVKSGKYKDVQIKD